MHERQQTRRGEDGRKQTQSGRRTAQRAVEEAEARVTTCEARVAALRAQLEDPALYSTPTGPAKAKALGMGLEVARTELDQALKAWETASAARELAADERS